MKNTYDKLPHINTIKFFTELSSPNFFRPETLEFFGQTMSDFKVVLNPDRTRCFIYAPCYNEGKFSHYTFREYNDVRLIQHPKVNNTKLSEILAFIRES